MTKPPAQGPVTRPSVHIGPGCLPEGPTGPHALLSLRCKRIHMRACVHITSLSQTRTAPTSCNHFRMLQFLQ